MSLTIPHSRLNPARLAILAVAVLLLRVVAWEVHIVDPDHGPLAECTICVCGDRSTDLLAPSPGQLGPAATAPSGIRVPIVHLPASRPVGRYPRGPPFLLPA